MANATSSTPVPASSLLWKAPVTSLVGRGDLPGSLLPLLCTQAHQLQQLLPILRTDLAAVSAPVSESPWHF
jgi:hypothetical protein